MRDALGSVFKKADGVWKVTVEAPRDPRTGKRQRLSKTIRGTRKEAEKVRAQLLAEVGRGGSVREVLTLDDFWERFYLPNAKKRLREITVHGYVFKYEAYVQPSFGSALLTRIDPFTIERWLDTMQTAKIRFEAYKMLRQVLAKAVRWNLLDANPCARVDVPKKPRYRPEVLDADDVRAYMKHFRGHQVEPAVLVALGGGLRRSEVAALDWRDVTPEGAVSVTKATTAVGGRAVEGDTKTEFSKRVVHLPRFIIERLNELRPEGEDAPLLPSSKGTRMHPQRISKLYEERRDTLPEGVRRVPFKNLRHTSLTMAIESGVDLLAVSRRAGHSNVAITSAYYVRPHENVDMAAADAMDRFLSE